SWSNQQRRSHGTWAIALYVLVSFEVKVVNSQCVHLRIHTRLLISICTSPPHPIHPSSLISDLHITPPLISICTSHPSFHPSSLYLICNITPPSHLHLHIHTSSHLICTSHPSSHPSLCISSCTSAPLLSSPSAHHTPPSIPPLLCVICNITPSSHLHLHHHTHLSSPSAHHTLLTILLSYLHLRITPSSHLHLHITSSSLYLHLHITPYLILHLNITTPPSSAI
ncbi:unnamed protein product, partial [Pleuronectes platessa]